MNATTSVTAVRSSWLARREIVLLDVREEGPFADAHPLFAASLPYSRLELEVLERIPRQSLPVVVYDDGEGLAQRAAVRLRTLGYREVSLLDGGLRGWAAAGAELFRDVNAPSKAFGELVAATRHTPLIAAEELLAQVNAGADLVILDARPFEEYRVMSIPTATNAPGGELVLQLRDLAPDPRTLVVVNCAGRTRSIIGAQSLINAGVPNRIAALRNGTIGWTLAGQALEHGQERRAAARVGRPALAAVQAAHALAERSGVSGIGSDTLADWERDPARTLYRFDVRTEAEYAAGHRTGFRHAPGGQLVQETDVFAPVRGARIVLTDDDGVRAPMTASWLAQMGWDVSVLRVTPGEPGWERGADCVRLPPLPVVEKISVPSLAGQLFDQRLLVVDLGASMEYARGHIPGAVFALRSELAKIPAAAPPGAAIVLVSSDSVLATFAAPELLALCGRPTWVLDGGTAAWKAAGLAIEQDPARFLSPPIDRYKRPYEGTDNPAHAMQAYLDWEHGLVAQLQRDGTHHFRVI